VGEKGGEKKGGMRGDNWEESASECHSKSRSRAITAGDRQDQIGSEIGQRFCRGDLNIRVKSKMSPFWSKWIPNKDLPGLKTGQAGFFREDSKGYLRK
jgi:hypothetical protein